MIDIAKNLLLLSGIVHDIAIIILNTASKNLEGHALFVQGSALHFKRSH